MTALFILGICAISGAANILETQVRYFQVMLDGNGDGVITYEELVAAARDCATLKTSIDSACVAAPLQRVHDALSEASAGLRVQKEFDANNGSLSPRSLVALVRRILPDLTQSEMRCLLICVEALDIDNLGVCTFRDLQQVCPVPQGACIWYSLRNDTLWSDSTVKRASYAVRVQAKHSTDPLSRDKSRETNGMVQESFTWGSLCTKQLSCIGCLQRS